MLLARRLSLRVCGRLLKRAAIICTGLSQMTQMGFTNIRLSGKMDVRVFVALFVIAETDRA